MRNTNYETSDDTKMNVILFKIVKTYCCIVSKAYSLLLMATTKAQSLVAYNIDYVSDSAREMERSRTRVRKIKREKPGFT